ncbi:MAG TPA: metal-dependent hydrolase [Gemmatimonadales bacterium]|nr:metal-dependent hydrolase [Gemmatimonadales bacterium]
MASIGHLAVGAAIGAVYSKQAGTRPRVTILTFAALALAPDLDLLTNSLGAIPNTPFSHRGITHSIIFALFVALVAGALVRGTTRRQLLTGLWVFAALGSHGLLDTMSRLGNGPMLFWPLTHAQYEFPWRPIPGVLTAEYYLTREAIPTLVVETMLFFPFIAYALTFFLPRPIARGANRGEVGQSAGG